MTARAPRGWAGFVFVLVCVGLVGWNVHAFVSNQDTFEPNDRIMVRSPAIEVVAAANPMGVVSTTFATYHQLRRFAGMTIVMSSLRREHVAHKQSFERMSRLRVELTPTRLELPPAAVKRIIQRNLQYSWALQAGLPLGVVVARGATRYVLVSQADHKIDLLLPEEFYQREVRALEGRP